jgi:hypothetical protein
MCDICSKKLKVLLRLLLLRLLQFLVRYHVLSLRTVLSVAFSLFFLRASTVLFSDLQAIIIEHVSTPLNPSISIPEIER